MKDLQIFKIGSSIIENPHKLNIFLKKFIKVKGDKILIHGGGSIASNLCRELKIGSNFINGIRVTCKETLNITVKVYAGFINKNTVSTLQSLGHNSIGLSGMDGNIIESKKRESNPDFGLVGDIQKINTDFLTLMLDNKITPVISSITYDKETNQILNTNADTIASSIAIAFKDFSPKLNYCFELEGVKDSDNIIEKIDRELYYKLKQKGVIKDGMIHKLDNCLKSVGKGIETRIVKYDNILNPISGTKIY